MKKFLPSSPSLSASAPAIFRTPRTGRLLLPSITESDLLASASPWKVMEKFPPSSLPLTASAPSEGSSRRGLGYGDVALVNSSSADYKKKWFVMVNVIARIHLHGIKNNFRPVSSWPLNRLVLIRVLPEWMKPPATCGAIWIAWK